MVSFVQKTSIFAFLGIAALLSACSSDNNADAGSPVDGATFDSVANGDGGNTAKMFTVSLTRTGEPTPCAGAGTAAMGSATVTVSADNTMIAVTNLTYTGLSGAASMAHIHFGTATTPSGPVVLPFTTVTSPINQTFTAANYVAASGAPANFAAFVTAVRAGNMAYINIHTAACPGGEIRGELQ